MSNEFDLNATARDDLGKGASRRLRRLANEVPAIIYGGSKKPQSISIAHKDLMKAVSNEAFFAHIITLHVDGKKEQVVIKDLQRHPAKPRLMHADFQRVSAKQTIHVKVPVHILNEEKCKGVKTGGGSLLRTITELEVVCLPKDLPEFLEVDVANLGVGEAIHISQISFPKGVSSVDLTHGADADHAVVTVQPPRGGVQDGEETDGEESGEA
ncbi:50S ribosomal protein L25/general stress protein Ctc [Pseudohongiella spirulinae]|uniref:Large ribosomal subunit protein bL25 n=1 Tax=Pseudohongiella spirulinae TaxID=1249552 RepID=A0A0S2KAV1_9GAMM|nr:50S ribosomal protein L25/general stress protein Ctc [Pseudohongiella spirulinae]ALO45432.1 50S ribosomal protein L25 [Pseudohongiella spirulinae]